MATNHYFNHYGTDTPDQKLVENIVIESIKSFGIDVHYMPRTEVNTDSIYGEDRISKFEDARMVEVYIKSIDGFEGDGTFVSNFGLEVRDQITFTIARRRFIDLNFETGNRDKEPLEGDLIFFPLSDSLFEIKHVQDTNVFYQMGGLQTFDLVCELFEYGDEAIDTGIEELDKIEREESYSIKFTLGTGAGTFTVGEQVYQGSTGYANSSIKGEVFDWNSSTSLLTVGNIVGTFDEDNQMYEYPFSIALEDDPTLLLEDETISTDAYANNVGIETVADGILDFSEGNPFSEGTGY